MYFKIYTAISTTVNKIFNKEKCLVGIIKT